VNSFNSWIGANTKLLVANNSILLTAFPGQCQSAVVDNAPRPRAPSNQLHDVWHTRWSAYSVLEGTDIYPCCGHLWNRRSSQRKFKVSVSYSAESVYVLYFHRFSINPLFIPLKILCRLYVEIYCIIICSVTQCIWCISNFARKSSSFDVPLN